MRVRFSTQGEEFVRTDKQFLGRILKTTWVLEKSPMARSCFSETKKIMNNRDCYSIEDIEQITI